MNGARLFTMWKSLRLLVALAAPLLVATCDTIVRVPLKKVPSSVRQDLAEAGSLEHEHLRELDEAFQEEFFGPRRSGDSTTPIEYLKNYQVSAAV
jgi:hypothetical protein